MEFLRWDAPREAEQAGDESLDAPRERADLVCYGALALSERGVLGQQVRIAQNSGERIVDFVSSACRQLAERDELLRLNHLRLKMLEVFERLAGGLEEPEAVAIHQLLPEEHQQSHDHQRYLRNSDAECADRRRRRTKKQGPNRHQR